MDGRSKMVMEDALYYISKSGKVIHDLLFIRWRHAINMVSALITEG